MIDDIIELIKEIVHKQEGVKKIDWLPDTFCSQWIIEWKEDSVEINTSWSCIIGDIKDSLNRAPKIGINKWDFINEWKKVIDNIKDALIDCGYNDNNLEDMNKLDEVYLLFTNYGVLYQNNYL